MKVKYALPEFVDVIYTKDIHCIVWRFGNHVLTTKYWHNSTNPFDKKYISVSLN